MPTYCRKTLFLKLTLFLLGLTLSVEGQMLNQGKWFKLYIPKEGLQSLSYDWLVKNNLNPKEINVLKIAIFSPKQANNLLNEHQIDTSQVGPLTQIPTFSVGLEDKQFNPGDQLLFPIKSNNNSYSDSTFCLLNLEYTPSKWATQEVSNLGSNPKNYAYRKETVSEEKYNYLQSGKLWVSEPIYNGEKKKLILPCPNGISSQMATFESNLFASSIQKSAISITSQNLTETINFDAISAERYDRKAIQNTFIKSFNLPSGCTNLEVQFQFNGSVGSANIGKTSLIYPSELQANVNQWYFWPNEQNTVTFQIINQVNATQIWSLTEQEFRLITPNKGTIEVTNPASRQFLLADQKLAFEPIFLNTLSSISNNLATNTEMLIICPKAFSSAANRFATFKNNQKIPTEVRTLEDLLIEYTAGANSLPALKSYLFKQKNYISKKLNYLLLLSDASVDAKEKNNLSSQEKRIPKIPTFESNESLLPLNSYASDDYLGILDDLKGTWDEDFSKPFLLKFAIGRLPAKSSTEAELLINKLIDGQQNQKQTITWLADDEDYNIHLLDAEYFANFLQKNAPQLITQKIYLDAFPMVKSGNSYLSPAANKKIIEAFQSNSGFIHFMGHGSENGWTDEKIFTINDIVQLNNKNNLPLLLTATCQFAKFDNPYVLSGAEALLCSDKGGAQAIIGASRPVFQNSNFNFGKLFYSILLDNLANPNFRLGDLLRSIKNSGFNSLNNRNILLLGDPSSPLPWIQKPLQILNDSYTWNQPNSIQINLPEPLSGNLQLYQKGEKIKTIGTKSPVTEFQADPTLWYQNPVSLGAGRVSTQVPAIKQEAPIVALRVSGKNSNGQWVGYKEVNTSVGVNPKIDNQGPNISQIEPNGATFVLSDSSGIGFFERNGGISKVIINDTIQIPLNNFLSNFVSDKICQLTLYNDLFQSGTNTVQFSVIDLLQNKSEKTFMVQVNKETNSLAKIYPNPFIDHIKIDFTTEQRWTQYTYRIQFTDLLGRVLLENSGNLEGNSIEIDLQSMKGFRNIICFIEIKDPISRLRKNFVSRLISGN